MSVDFLIIGAYKAGTTTLDHLLRQVDGLYLPAMREPSHFAFDRGADGSLIEPPFFTSAMSRSYTLARARSATAYQALFDGARPDELIGECSPEYLRHPEAAGRIYRAAPEVRLAVLLRHPVRRAFSDYCHQRRDGVEARSFEDSLRAELVEMEEGRFETHYLRTSLYGEPLAVYVDRFGRDQVRAYIYEEWVGRFGELAGDLAGWLGVRPPGFPQGSPVLNRSGLPVNKAAARLFVARRRLSAVARHVPAPLRRADRWISSRLLVPQRLDHEALERWQPFFAEDVAAVEEVLGRSLDVWRR